jgi:hypothetical protein
MDKISKKELFWISFFIVLIIFWTLYFNEYMFPISFMLESLFFSIIFYLVYLLWGLYKKNPGMLKFPNFYFHFLYRLSILIIVLTWIIGSFSYYYLNVNPYKISTYTITNWDKEVVFNGMVHIWTDPYYSQVASEIEKQIENGYVYLFEWVRAWTEENETKFDNALGFKLNKETYPILSKVYGLETQQDNKDLMSLLDKWINVDISIDDIISEYEKIEVKDENKIPQEAQDISNEVVKITSEINPKVLEKIIIPVNKAVLSFIIRSENIQQLATEELWNSNLFNIILGKRNEYLVNYILASENKKMTITYWDLHFDWVLKLLRKSDKNWKIKTITYKYPFND